MASLDTARVVSFGEVPMIGHGLNGEFWWSPLVGNSSGGRWASKKGELVGSWQQVISFVKFARARPRGERVIRLCRFVKARVGFGEFPVVSHLFFFGGLRWWQVGWASSVSCFHGCASPRYAEYWSSVNCSMCGVALESSWNWVVECCVCLEVCGIPGWSLGLEPGC